MIIEMMMPSTLVMPFGTSKVATHVHHLLGTYCTNHLLLRESFEYILSHCFHKEEGWNAFVSVNGSDRAEDRREFGKIDKLVKQSSRNGRKLIVLEIATIVNTYQDNTHSV